MAFITAGLSMSLDGFIAGPDDGDADPLGRGGERLFAWYQAGETEYVAPGGSHTFRVDSASAAVLRETFASVGAFITGRRTFEIAHGWGGRHPLDVPVFVLTPTIPDGWPRSGVPFTFVTDGLESAIAQAAAVAGDKKIAVNAASLVQQCLKRGLLDEIHVDLAPVLLGGGVSLFDHLGVPALDLEQTRAVVTPSVTHLTYRVVR